MHLSSSGGSTTPSGSASLAEAVVRTLRASGRVHEVAAGATALDAALAALASGIDISEPPKEEEAPAAAPEPPPPPPARPTTPARAAAALSPSCCCSGRRARDELCAARPSDRRRVLRTRDLAAAACGEAGALGEQLRGLVKAKKVVPAPLQLHLLKRVMAGADAAASDDVAVDILTDFPRSAGQLNQLGTQSARCSAPCCIEGTGDSLAKSVARPLRAGGRVVDVPRGGAGLANVLAHLATLGIKTHEPGTPPPPPVAQMEPLPPEPAPAPVPARGPTAEEIEEEGRRKLQEAKEALARRAESSRAAAATAAAAAEAATAEKEVIAMENAQRAAGEQLAKMRASCSERHRSAPPVRDGVGRSRGGKEGTRGDPEGGRSVRSGEEGGGRRRAAAGVGGVGGRGAAPVVADAPLCCCSGRRAHATSCGLARPSDRRAGAADARPRGGGDYGGERGGRRAARPHA